MKGINRSQHEELRRMLIQLEILLSQRRWDEALIGEMLKVRQGLQALEESHQRYLILLRELAFHIEDYEDLYRNVKGNCLGNSSRRLLKEEKLNAVENSAISCFD